MNINEYYQLWIDKKISFEKLRKETATYSYSIIKKMPITEDTAHNLFISVYPKLSDIINRYNIKKKSYANYLIMTLNYRRKNLKRIKLNGILSPIPLETYELFNYSKNISSSFAVEEKSPYYSTTGNINSEIANNSDPNYYKRIASYLTKNKKIPSSLLKKRLTLIILKNSINMQDQEIEMLCRHFNINKTKIDDYLNTINQKIESKKIRYQYYNGIRNRYYNSLQILRKLLATSEDPYQQEKLIQKINSLKERLTKMNKIIKKIKIEPSNKEIAETVKIPKSTVDSIFFKLAIKH